MWDDTTESPDSYNKSFLLDMYFCNNLFHFNQSSCWDKAFTVLFQTFDQPKMWWGGVVTRQLEYRMGCCLGEKRAWVSIKRGSLTFF